MNRADDFWSFWQKSNSIPRGIFKVSILTQGTWTLVKFCRRNFCNAIKSEYSPNNFKNPKLKNVHFWKDFFDNISPIIGSSNHKGIVFLFFVFVSLDENQSSQYSFSRKEEVCFHFFLQFEIFFVKISLLFGAFLPCMYVYIFVESIFFNVSSPIIATNFIFPFNHQKYLKKNVRN